MPNYCVNHNPQLTGEHEVHAEGCPWWPANNQYLGWHATCHYAVGTARNFYINVDGCRTCSNECHTR